MVSNPASNLTLEDYVLSAMALQLCQRARPIYLEISNYFRSSRAAVVTIERQASRRLLPSLRLADQGRRSLHQGQASGSEEEADVEMPEVFETYMDSCTSPKLQ